MLLHIGLDNDEHYTTAYELAKMADYALKNKTFANIVTTKKYTVNINGRQRNISNTNELLGSMPGVYGVKTGFTNGANRCLVTSCKRDNLDIITVVLGADTKKFRTKDSASLINYAMNNYKDVEIESRIKKEFNKWKELQENNIYVYKGEIPTLQVELEELKSNNITIKKSQENDIKIDIHTIKQIEAPVEKGYVVGVVSVKVGKEEKLVANIITKEEVKKKKVLTYFKYFVENYTKILEQST